MNYVSRLCLEPHHRNTVGDFDPEQAFANISHSKAFEWSKEESSEIAELMHTPATAVWQNGETRSVGCE
jgi:hypothetical protein